MSCPRSVDAVLAPFAGSGTTGIAALLEGFRFVGIEQSAEYVEIARLRVDHAALDVASEEERRQGDLFARTSP